MILGVTCTEVHDTVTTNGVLTEDTLDWFAQDTTGNVWYFGENTHELADGLISTIDGTFRGGVDGAQPGIVMKAHPAIGDFYRQEFDLGNAEDFAEVVGLSASVTVPFGSFTNCLDTRETTPLEPDLHQHKFYAAGVGDMLETEEERGTNGADPGGDRAVAGNSSGSRRRPTAAATQRRRAARPRSGRAPPLSASSPSSYR